MRPAFAAVPALLLLAPLAGATSTSYGHEGSYCGLMAEPELGACAISFEGVLSASEPCEQVCAILVSGQMEATSTLPASMRILHRADAPGADGAAICANADPLPALGLGCAGSTILFLELPASTCTHIQVEAHLDWILVGNGGLASYVVAQFLRICRDAGNELTFP
jgi:hypothetical protein